MRYNHGAQYVTAQGMAKCAVIEHGAGGSWNLAAYILTLPLFVLFRVAAFDDARLLVLKSDPF